jgi:energy-coupling factor transporter ATP-binding protein EcfA2
MNHRPIILGIVGDSGAGKTTLTRGIGQILGEENITVIGTDDYHRYDRSQRAEIGITALHPDCNYLDIMQQHLMLLRTGQSILKPIYNHHTGTFDPPVNESEETTAHLGVKLVLRPTISHPDLSQILAGNSGDRVSTIRLTLDRDMGKPVDVLEIDAHATIDGVKTLARMICADLPELHSVCDLEINPNLGQITGTTGETLQSYPLALTQLLITYHMLKATQKYR